MAKKKQNPDEVQIPESHEHLDESWKNAYRYAFAKGCSEKGSVLYADAHFEDFEQAGEEESVEELKAKVQALEARLASQ